MTSRRIQWIDAAKGVAILLVAWLHAVSPVMGEKGTPLFQLYNYIYWLVNPTFLLLAGLVSGKVLTANARGRLEILKKRSLQLLVPYCTWAVIYLGMKLVFKDHIRFDPAPLWTVALGNNPAGQLWFLYVFFLLTVLSLLIREKTMNIWLVCGLIISFLVPMIPISVCFPGIGLGYSLFQIGFYFGGLFLSRHRDKLFSSLPLALIAALLGLIQLILIMRNTDLWYFRLLGTAGVCYSLLYILSKLPGGWLVDGLSFLGQRSMDIYILHAPFLMVGRVIMLPLLGKLPWLYTFAMIVLSIAAALFTSRFILERIKPLRFLLLGK